MNPLFAFELYRMNVPIFVPSPELLLKGKYEKPEWDGAIYPFITRINLGIPVDYGDEEVSRRGVRFRSAGKPHPSYYKHPGTGAAIEFDPNDDLCPAAFFKWMTLANYYQWPHVQYYESYEDLKLRLEVTDFDEISARMAAYNQRVESYVFGQWGKLADLVKERKSPPIPDGSYQDAMCELWPELFDETSCVG